MRGFEEITHKSANIPAYELSVITVCRNAGSALEHTFESVLWHKRNGNVRIEHILIDGESTDGSREYGFAAYERGDIEQFISEPDAGIYDAMNKGVKLARGKVLFFLNCGDTFSQNDLRPFIEPILKDKYATVAAGVIFRHGNEEFHGLPEYGCRFMDTYVCHQGYLAADYVFHQLGGFDVSFKCIADGFFMGQAAKKFGPPYIVAIPISQFIIGGFSSNAKIHFFAEFIELRRRFWPDIVHLCQEDRDYLYYVVKEIMDTVTRYEQYSKLHSENATLVVPELKRQCREIRKLVPEYSRKFSLWWAEAMMLNKRNKPHFVQKIQNKLTRYIQALAVPPANSPYIQKGISGGPTFRELLSQRWKYIWRKRA